jgi:hypothetical protein
VVPWQSKWAQRRPLSGQPPLGCGANLSLPLLYTVTGSPEFGHLSLAARHLLLGDLTSAVTASDQGVEQGTHQKQHLAWTRWTKWLDTVELFDDAYLEAFQPRTRTRLLGAFAAAIRSARFSSAAYCQLAAGTVSDTVNHVVSAFVDSGFADPRKHGDGASSRFLQRQYKCYRNLDADVKQQKAITASILVNMFDHAQTAGEKAAAELSVGAFFFAMRSCEYCHVDGARRTKSLRLHNLRFIEDNRTLDLTDPRLASADAIAITFEFQKTDVRSETVHQHATHLLVLCPVRRWAAIVQRILSYPGGALDSLVSVVITNDRHRLITSKFVATQLRAAASRIGEDVLGFPATDIGTHSLRSGAAMAMYLAGVPVFTIMLIGRWSSDAFLRYIRRQVLQFSAGVATRMVSATSQNFFTLPDFDPEDPRTRAHRTNFHSPPQSGSRQRTSTPDHVFKSLLPRFELSI